MSKRSKSASTSASTTRKKIKFEKPFSTTSNTFNNGITEKSQSAPRGRSSSKAKTTQRNSSSSKANTTQRNSSSSKAMSRSSNTNKTSKSALRKAKRIAEGKSTDTILIKTPSIDLQTTTRFNLVNLNQDRYELGYKEGVQIFGLHKTPESLATKLRGLFTGDADKIETILRGNNPTKDICWICKGKINPKDKKVTGNFGESDHIFSVVMLAALGLATTLVNLQNLIDKGFTGQNSLIKPSCKLCNGVKGDLSFLSAMLVKSSSTQECILVGTDSVLDTPTQILTVIKPLSLLGIDKYYRTLANKARDKKITRGTIEFFGYKREKILSTGQVNDWIKQRSKELFYEMAGYCALLQARFNSYTKVSSTDLHKIRGLNMLGAATDVDTNMGTKFIRGMLYTDKFTKSGITIYQPDTTISYSNGKDDSVLNNLQYELNKKIGEFIKGLFTLLNVSVLDNFNLYDTKCNVFQPEFATVFIIIYNALFEIKYYENENQNQTASIIDLISSRSDKTELSKEVVYKIMNLISLFILYNDTVFLDKLLNNIVRPGRSSKVTSLKERDLTIIKEAIAKTTNNIFKEMKTSYTQGILFNICAMLVAIFPDNRFFGDNITEPISKTIFNSYFGSQKLTYVIMYKIVTEIDVDKVVSPDTEIINASNVLLQITNAPVINMDVDEDVNKAAIGLLNLKKSTSPSISL